MKNTRIKNPNPIVAGIIGLALSLAVIAGGAALFFKGVGAMRDRPNPQEAVAALEDAMKRSDADAVMKRVDDVAIFNDFFRQILTKDLGRAPTEAELGKYSAKNASFLPIMKQAVMHGVVTKADQDGATPGTLLYALTRLSEGRIERKDDAHFLLAFADGTALRFEKRGGEWIAVGFGSIAAGIDAYRGDTYDAIGRNLQNAYKANSGGAAVNAPAAGN